jgi:hypothetical protein
MNNESKLLGGIPAETWAAVEVEIERQCPDIVERYSVEWIVDLQTGEVKRA